MKKILFILYLSLVSLTSCEIKDRPAFSKESHYEWDSSERKIHYITKTAFTIKKENETISASENEDKVLDIQIPAELNIETRKNSSDSPDLETLLVKKNTLRKHVSAKINHFNWYAIYKNAYKYNDKTNAIERISSKKDIKETIESNVIVFVFGIMVFLCFRFSVKNFLDTKEEAWVLSLILTVIFLAVSFVDRDSHIQWAYFTNLATLFGLTTGFILTRWYKNRQKKKKELQEKPV